MAAWQLSDEEKSAYAGYLFSFERGKNLGILGITTFLIVVIFGLFILFIDEGKGAMALVALGLILLLSLLPWECPSTTVSATSAATASSLSAANSLISTASSTTGISPLRHPESETY